MIHQTVFDSINFKFLIDFVFLYLNTSVSFTVSGHYEPLSSFIKTCSANLKYQLLDQRVKLKCWQTVTT